MRWQKVALSAQKSKKERLPTVISYGLKGQLIAVPRLDNCTCKEQAQAIWNVILDWNLENKVQILYRGNGFEYRSF